MDMSKFPPIRTLGTLLVEDAQRLRARHTFKPGWLDPLTILMSQVSSLPVPSDERFQRRETVSRGTAIARPVAGETSAASHSLGEEPDPALNSDWPDPIAPARPFALNQQTTEIADEQLQRRTRVSPGAAIARPVAGGTSAASHSLEEEPVLALNAAPIAPARLSALNQQTEATSLDFPSTGQTLSSDIREQLTSTLGSSHASEQARIHDDEASDSLARREQAAAVTIGQHIFFRQGQFRPHDRAGLALLTHEMVHVMNAMRPNISWRRATVGGIQEEERDALAAEQQIHAPGLGRGGFFPQETVEGLMSPGNLAPPFAGNGQRSISREASPTLANLPGGERSPGQMQPSASSPTFQPMRAALQRETQYPPVIQRATSMLSTEENQRALYRDLLKQVRSDFERGG